MAEWLKAAVSKTAVGVTPPRVRIPLSPPASRKATASAGLLDLKLDDGGTVF
jgi:hypothetical protein